MTSSPTPALTLLLDGLNATQTLGRLMAEGLPPQAVVLLEGGLGAGKTTLVKAVCQAYGINPQAVISPTYTLVNIYPGPVAVYHVDFYRLETPEALREMDPEDWLNPQGPTFVEWPQAALPLLAGHPLLRLSLATVSGQPQARSLTLWGDAPYGPLLKALAQRFNGQPLSPL